MSIVTATAGLYYLSITTCQLPQITSNSIAVLNPTSCSSCM